MKLDTVAVWNDLHKTPELGFQEFKTSAYIAAALEKMGYAVTRGIAGTGVLAVKKGTEPGPRWMRCPLRMGPATPSAFMPAGTTGTVRCFSQLPRNFLTR